MNIPSMNPSFTSSARASWPAAAVLLAWAGHLHVLAQHQHLNVGATHPEAGAALTFANAASFDTASAWFMPMPLQTNGLHAGLFRAGSLTFTVLPATPDFGGPSPGHPAPGARVMAEIVSLDGPIGGEIGFWDSDGIAEADTVTHRIPVGTRHGSWRLALSEGDGSAGTDPYGHIHGRFWTASTPGLYTLGLRAVDVSTSGPAGGPWHAASPVLQLHLQAGTTLDIITISSNPPALRFAAEKGRTYQILHAPVLQPSAWHVLAGPFTGNGRVQTYQGPLPDEPSAFFRLQVP